jgi:hypothetical protein
MPREGLIKKAWTGRFLLAAWALIAVIGLAYLSREHLASLPEPGNEALLGRALLRLRRGSNASFLVHVVYGECSCSRSLFAHLLARGRFSGAEELILYVGTGSNKQQAAERSGFEFSAISDSELVSRYGLEAAPVLVVFDANGKLRYAGGYYDHPATITPLDERIHAHLATGASVQALPVFGCAVSPRLRKSLDPLRALSSR